MKIGSNYRNQIFFSAAPLQRKAGDYRTCICHDAKRDILWPHHWIKTCSKLKTSRLYFFECRMCFEGLSDFRATSSSRAWPMHLHLVEKGTGRIPTNVRRECKFPFSCINCTELVKTSFTKGPADLRSEKEKYRKELFPISDFTRSLIPKGVSSSPSPTNATDFLLHAAHFCLSPFESQEINCGVRN